MSTGKTDKFLLAGLAAAGAVILFLAGALWQSRSTKPKVAGSTGQAEASVPATQLQHPQEPPGATSGETQATQKGQVEQAGVVVNGRQLAAEQVEQLQAAYGAIQPGSYWYDPVSGLWGRNGHEFAGYIQPGLDLGQVSRDASNGTTGVFVNGRELNVPEAGFYKQIFGTVVPGRYWLDGRTGNIGYEGDSTPRVNLIAAIQRAQPAGRRGPGFWPSGPAGNGGMVGASDGNCSIVSTDSGSYATPGCD